ncbi:hypothetical protein E2C01_020782 [Portunus trituberculatus]|uniref:Uncharacterized protein n=1 Tax=Portunus trituberculatus TaxID=210409 RepID=A0A5B7E1I0_PORTR|nr:hypothetical protein [Portunus trituberculatus]
MTPGLCADMTPPHTEARRAGRRRGTVRPSAGRELHPQIMCCVRMLGNITPREEKEREKEMICAIFSIVI